MIDFLKLWSFFFFAVEMLVLQDRARLMDLLTYETVEAACEGENETAPSVNQIIVKDD